MTALDFSRSIIEECSRRPFIRGVEILLLDEPVTKIKIALSDDLNIAVFHNAETQRFSYALIQGSQRIFGADNARGCTFILLTIPKRTAIFRK